MSQLSELGGKWELPPFSYREAIMIDGFFYWLGVATFGLAGVYGLLEGGFWLIDKILKALGLWAEFWRVLQRIHRERAEQHDPPAG
jgi:hypothetical protein